MDWRNGQTPVQEVLLQSVLGGGYLGLQVAPSLSGQFKVLFCTLYDLINKKKRFMFLINLMLWLPLTSPPQVCLLPS